MNDATEDDEYEGWGRGVVSPDMVTFSDEAKNEIETWAKMVPEGYICSLCWSLGAARYDRNGRLESSRGPHIGLGAYEPGEVPEKYINQLFDVNFYLAINPHPGERPLKSARVWVENGRLVAEFDPPAPEAPKIAYSEQIDPKTGRPLEGDET